MRTLYQRFACVFGIALVLFTSPSAGCGTVVLKKAFVAKYKDRATIDATFVVDHAHKKPNVPAKDGDMHVAGRAPKEVGLPMVAEVINAKDQSAATGRIHAVEGTETAVPIWFEHPANSQTQFADFPVAANTNPDHSFEIHPITKFDSNDLSLTFKEIKGFKPYPASKAFTSYESLTFTVSATPSAITLTSKKSGYNYTKFRMQLKGAREKLRDECPPSKEELCGFAVLADVFDAASNETEDAVAANVRMIFVPRTAPAQKLFKDNLGDGDSLTVIGIPRVNLNAVYKFVCPVPDVRIDGRADGAVCKSSSRPATRKLPYEMIVIAVLD